MNVKINETGELVELTITDPKTGLCWINDLMGNYNELPEYDDEDEVYLMTQEAFDWWKELTEAYQAADNRKNELLKELTGDKYYVAFEALEDISGDLEDYPRYLDQVCDEVEALEKKYVIFDRTANTGKHYIDENGDNAENASDANPYDTREEAEKVAQSLTKGQVESWDEWAKIIEVYV